ncbi:hypothetical protein HG530_008623 [Fusarium avenaceum]|nr:hypothetical protein HG530_008623 [Fusarium avenaceum]
MKAQGSGPYHNGCLVFSRSKASSNLSSWFRSAISRRLERCDLFRGGGVGLLVLRDLEPPFVDVLAFALGALPETLAPPFVGGLVFAFRVAEVLAPPFADALAFALEALSETLAPPFVGGLVFAFSPTYSMNSEAGASEGSCQFLTAAGTGNTNLYTRDRLLSLISLCQLSLSPLHISSCIYFNERKVATRCPKTIHRMVAATIEVRAAGKDPASDEVAIGAGTAHAALGKANVTQWKLKTSSLLESLNGNQSTDMETGTSLRNKTHAVKGTNQLSFTTINNLCTNPGNTTMTSSGPMRKSLCTIGAHRPLSKSQGTDIKVATILLSKCQGTDIEAARILLNTTQVRVPQAQNRPPIQAPIQEPSRANTQVSLPSQIRRDSIDTVDRSGADGQLTDTNSRKRKRKFTGDWVDIPEISGDAIEPAGKHDPNISKMYRRIPGGYSGSFDSYESALIALKQTLGPDEIARGKWRITSGEEYPREDPRIKKRRIQELESTIVSRPLFELLPPATPEEQARIDRARAARAARLQAINAVPNIPAQPAGPSCGNCKNDSHVVAKCNKPQSDGLIHGCAICNADDHSTWACGEFPRGDGKELDQLRELVFKRMNQPPLQGKYWYPLMYSYMQAHPFTEVPGLPWTTEFSQRYHKDSRLQSRLRYDMDNDELFTVDPKTRTWQAAVAHYGDPRQRQSKSKTKQ